MQMPYRQRIAVHFTITGALLRTVPSIGEQPCVLPYKGVRAQVEVGFCEKTRILTVFSLVYVFYQRDLGNL